MIPLISNRFQNCFYKIIGIGKPLFLIHGFAEDHRIWYKIENELSERFQLILPELPGSGKSALPNEKMSMELLADYIFEICVQEKIDEAIFLGHSMGGYLLLEFLKKYEQKISGLGLINSICFADNDEKKESRLKSIELVKKGGKENILNTLVNNGYAEINKKTHFEEINLHKNQALGLSNESVVAYLQAMHDRKDNATILQKTKKPILFIGGNEDVSAPKNLVIKQSILPQLAVIEIFENCGHQSMIEKKNELIEKILQFNNIIFK